MVNDDDYFIDYFIHILSIFLLLLLLFIFCIGAII